MAIEFEWDAEKANTNQRKHKVSFDEAATVFGDPMASIFADEVHSSEEVREIIIRTSDRHRLLLVSFTERQKKIRIISARRATKRERLDYEEKPSP
jgi:uncharacterized protein